jgi:cyclic dehypoxanthinyl futalosine synthase
LKSKSNKILEHVNEILSRAMAGEYLSLQDGLQLWDQAQMGQLVFAADMIRRRMHPDNSVTWLIDRNVNITNVCMSMCTFCNFCRPRKHPEAYITTLEQYRQKIDEMVALGGDQLLLQGGMHPDLGLDFYIHLFRSLKSYYPSLKLHALGPPEIVYLAKTEGMTYEKVLTELIAAGLDSLPGAGAEILSDRVRTELSAKKATVEEWLK